MNNIQNSVGTPDDVMTIVHMNEGKTFVRVDRRVALVDLTNGVRSIPPISKAKGTTQLIAREKSVNHNILVLLLCQ